MAQTTIQSKESYKTGGDDLDDGLELDPDLLAGSDEEGDDDSDIERNVDEELGSNDDDEKDLPPLEGEEDEIVKSPIIEPKKRKVEEVIEGDDHDQQDKECNQDNSDEARQAEKKRRKKEKEKERKAKKRQNQSGITSETIPTHLPKSDLSSILLKSIKESYPSSSSVELDDIQIPESNLLDPPNYTPIPNPPSTVSNTENKKSDMEQFKPLQKRIQDLSENLSKKKLNVGQPQIIILALSGLRCADLVRGVRDVKGDGEVAKLFAKHFKLADQVKYLHQKKVSIAVGTPARVGKLLTEDAIKITSETVLLLDISHQDSKTRTILNLPEVRDELWKSVFSGKSRETLLKGGVKIGAF
ncbi:uncharacterized protein L201_002965 [Kwoniella dendrophila CBS 6074]|uniref:Protein CMS1 n=1 Tax=Kwoniella dendrophila CBS 6074 TaxID=1295534 RepID=A0AAX4JU40_9TREE